MEFVPKTLADLHIEGIHDLNNGRRYGSTQSLSRPRQHIPPSSSVGDLSTSDPFKAWEAPSPNRTHARPAPGFKPHPAPRNQFNGRDPWTGDFGFICWVIFCSVLVVDCCWRWWVNWKVFFLLQWWGFTVCFFLSNPWLKSDHAHSSFGTLARFGAQSVPWRSIDRWSFNTHDIYTWLTSFILEIHIRISEFKTGKAGLLNLATNVLKGL